MSQRTSRSPTAVPGTEWPGSPWRPLTRRAFVTALGAAAAALALDSGGEREGASDADVDRPRTASTGTRWVGHC